jgi:hypothetical protein
MSGPLPRKLLQVNNVITTLGMLVICERGEGGFFMRTRVRAIIGSLFAGGLTTTLQTCSLCAFLQSVPLLGYVVLTDVNFSSNN